MFNFATFWTRPLAIFGFIIFAIGWGLYRRGHGWQPLAGAILFGIGSVMFYYA